MASNPVRAECNVFYIQIGPSESGRISDSETIRFRTDRILNASDGLAANWVHMSGTKKERRRAGEYLQCVMDQLRGPVTLPTDGRDDVTVMAREAS